MMALRNSPVSSLCWSSSATNRSLSIVTSSSTVPVLIPVPVSILVPVSTPISIPVLVPVLVLVLAPFFFPVPALILFPVPVPALRLATTDCRVNSMTRVPLVPSAALSC
ncbi:hypothetical protein J132_03140 [Termitomyces sp. J132]|nr:hypothetical protein J132_03140 [Termitomyces sp. J132]